MKTKINPDAMDGGIIMVVNAILTEAIKRNSRVVRILPSNKSLSFRIVCGNGRGNLQTLARIPRHIRLAIISRLKTMTTLKPCGHNCAQVGDIEFNINDQGVVKIGIFFFPATDDQEEVVLVFP